VSRSLWRHASLTEECLRVRLNLIRDNHSKIEHLRKPRQLVEVRVQLLLALG
jgi:hypothetical protein